MIILLFLQLPLILFLFPIWFVIFLIAAANEVLFAVARPILARLNRSESLSAVDTPVKKEASIVILNWNGRSLMEECLPSVVEAVAHDGGNHEILVIDNGSTDDSVAFLQENFPTVRIVRLDKNYGFVKGYNLGIKEAQKDILVFLNNDMAVKKDFLRPLLDGFTAPDVFAVSSQILFPATKRKREETGKTRALWIKGWIAFNQDTPTEGDLRNGYVPAFWLGGGSAAVDRRKFLALGGFNTLLSPFYMEDVDISYKAWKQGWKVLFCAASQVIHKHRSTSSRLNKDYIERVIARNRLLFIWENITDPKMFFQHLAFLLFLPLRRSWDLNITDTYHAFIMALARLPQALRKRNKNRLTAKISDREIFQVANRTFAFKEKYAPRPKIDPQRLRILFACPYFPSLRSGGGVRMYHTIAALAKQHDVSLVSFWDDEADLEYLPAMEKICKRVVTIRRLPIAAWSIIPDLPPAIEIDFGDPTFRGAIEEMLGDDDFDVIQAEYLQTAPQIPDSRRIVKVITHHEVQNAAVRTRMTLEAKPLQKINLAFQWLRWLNADIRLTRRFDQVVTLTAEDAWEIHKYDPKLPIHVIPTGIDLDYFHPQQTQEEPHSLIYVGNFRHPPNVDSALFLVNEVLPLVTRQFPDTRLYIVGANPPQQIQDLASPDRIIVTGWVDDMRPYIYRSNIYVFPIRLGVGLRNKMLEAWAMGKPTVTTRLGVAGLGAVHGENTWIAETAPAFAEGICRLFEDPSLREKLGQNARAYVEQHHNWSTVARKYVDVYLRALRSRGLY